MGGKTSTQTTLNVQTPVEQSNWWSHIVGTSNLIEDNIAGGAAFLGAGNYCTKTVGDIVGCSGKSLDVLFGLEEHRSAHKTLFREGGEGGPKGLSEGAEQSRLS